MSSNENGSPVGVGARLATASSSLAAYEAARLWLAGWRSVQREPPGFKPAGAEHFYPPRKRGRLVYARFPAVLQRGELWRSVSRKSLNTPW